MREETELHFRPISLEDKGWVSAYFQKKGCPSYQYSFGCLFIWRKIYPTEICESDGFLFIRLQIRDRTEFVCPVGTGDLKGAVEKLLSWCKGQGVPLRLSWVPAEDKAALEALFPGRLTIALDRDRADYLYERERLSTLAGRKLQAKRNYVNRIKKENWSYEAISRENLAECLEVQRQWCQGRDHCTDEGSREENCAVQQAFRHFWELGFAGGCIRLNGKVIAYTMGEPLTADTFIVHIEKALPDIPGAYPLINQQFVQNAMAGFSYVNREDDAGSEGLRKAKLSYDPWKIWEMYNVVVSD